MQTRYISPILSIVVLFCFSVVSHAGYVVTDQTRQWAKAAVQQEKAVSSKTGANTVAVLYFKNNSRQPELDLLQKGLAIMLITDLSQVKKIEVVEREKLQALVEEMDFGKSGLVDTGTAPRVGRLLGARFLVGGEFRDDKDRNIVIASDMVNVIKETVFAAPTAKGKIEMLMDMEKTLLFDIIRDLNIELTPKQIKLLKTPLSTSHLALIHLFEAVDKSDRGDYPAAENLYKKALKKDPNLVLAKKALEQLAAMGLLSKKGNTKKMLWDIRSNVSLSDQLSTEYPLKRTKSPTEVNQHSQGQPTSTRVPNPPTTGP